MKTSTKLENPDITRRGFCRTTLKTAAMISLAGASTPSRAAGKQAKFYKNLGNGHIGVKADQRQALAYAAQFGFDSITPSVGELAKKTKAETATWQNLMQAKGIRYGTSGLPVEFRKDDARFQDDLARLPKQASALQKMGVTRMATWILPGHGELTYLQNFKRHERRLRRVATILRNHDIRLGLEFVGPRTSRARNRFPFICTQHGMMELVQAIDMGNVGLLMDSWHWYTSHGTVAELEKLSGRDIIHVHVNDAPAGIDVDQQVDNRRQLPVTSGVIDMKGFINTLVKIGYNGPIECEPFDNELRQMDDAQAVKKTAAALKRVWGLID